MREMKESGNIWLGNIPKNWDLYKFKEVTIIFNGNSISDSKKDNYLDENNARPYISSKDIDATYFSANYDNGMYVKKDDYSFRVATKNSTLMCIEGGSAGKKKTFLEQDVTFVNKLCCFTGTDKIDSKFLFYYLCSPNYEDEFKNNLSGLIGGVSVSTLKNIQIVVPSIVEQKAIAAFLDAKCSEIDALTKDIEKQIEVLEDYKKSVITEAVTKGLNLNVEMKDSGVEWIGSCPKNWDIIPFKYCLKERNEKNNPVKTDERLSLSIDKGVTLYSEKTTNLDRFKDDVSQYKIAHQGDFVLNSMNMIVGAVGISNYYGCVSPAYYVYYDELDNHISAKYCNYLFSSKPMRKVLFSLGKGIMAIDRGDDQINTCRLKVSRYDMLHLSMPWPTYCEQKEIVEHLDLKCSEISALILDKQKQLEILADYKKSLIYEYVTGKKEVIA